MANHGYVIVYKRDINMDDVENEIRSVITSKLSGRFTLVRFEDSFFIHHNDDESCGFPIYVTTLRSEHGKFGVGTPCIELRHSCNGDVAWLVTGLLTDYLANKFDGMIADDGHDLVYEPTNELIDAPAPYIKMIENRTKSLNIILRKFVSRNMLRELKEMNDPELSKALIGD